MKRDATVAREAMGGVELVTVRLGQMVAYAMQHQGATGRWTVTIGRKVPMNYRAADLRADRSVLARREYARALYRVEIGKA